MISGAALGKFRAWVKPATEMMRPGSEQQCLTGIVFEAPHPERGPTSGKQLLGNALPLEGELIRILGVQRIQHNRGVERVWNAY